MTNSRAVEIRIVTKLADETVNNSVTVQDDDELFITPSKGATYYHFECALHVNSGSTPDIKFIFPLNGNTGKRHNGNLSAANGGGVVSIETPSTIVTTGAGTFVIIHGFILTGSTPGQLILKWAQAVQDVSDSKILAGSYLKITEGKI